MPGEPSKAAAKAAAGPEKRGSVLQVSKSAPVLNPSAVMAAAELTTTASINAVAAGSNAASLVKMNKMLRETFSTPIVGDVFGTHNESLDGMLYRSRVNEDLHSTLLKGGEVSTEEKSNPKHTKGKNLGSSLGSIEFDRDSDSDGDAMESMNPRQQLATTIRNWSGQEENDSYLINEGAVHALIALTSMEDSTIKKCSAGALCNLASRAHNRESLLAIGAATGVISISMQVKSWSNAKMCAQTLSFLSMHVGGEAVLAKEGAILACVILLGLKGNRLLPICVQALYNLTCSADYYKGQERIVKAFLSLPAMPPGFVVPGSAFDTTWLLLQSLRNVARFSWIRARLVEDGVVQALTTISYGFRQLAQHHGMQAVQMQVALVTENIRLLSESQGVRAELVQKGAFDVLQQCLPFCDGRARLQLVKAIHNLVPGIPLATAAGSSASTATAIASGLPESAEGDAQQQTQQYGSRRRSTVTQITPQQHFELAVNVVIGLARDTDSLDPVAFEYLSACLAVFSAEGMRGNGTLLKDVVDAMPSLLPRIVGAGALTQLYVVTACAHLLFSDVRADVDTNRLEKLMVCFVNQARTAPPSDPQALVAVAVVLTKMSQDKLLGLPLLNKHAGMIEDALELLLRILHTDGVCSNAVVQETGAVGVCRIALLMPADGLTLQRRQSIAEILYRLLDNADRRILVNVLAAIRALSERNVCVSELLSLPTLDRIAAIIGKFGAGDAPLSRTSSAVLAAFSYDPDARVSLVNTPQVLQVLWASTKAEDSLTREMVSTTICNMSVEVSACRQMVECGVVEVLAALSGATSEVIQEMCAKCFCNLTCVPDIHNAIIQNKGEPPPCSILFGCSPPPYLRLPGSFLSPLTTSLSLSLSLFSPQACKQSS